MQYPKWLFKPNHDNENRFSNFIIFLVIVMKPQPTKINATNQIVENNHVWHAGACVIKINSRMKLPDNSSMCDFSSRVYFYCSARLSPHSLIWNSFSHESHHILWYQILMLWSLSLIREWGENVSPFPLSQLIISQSLIISNCFIISSKQKTDASRN